MPPQSVPPCSKPVYFHLPTQGHGYLSQWYHSPFTHAGTTYATTEMWMMVQKARLFHDAATATRMIDTLDPKTHKALGRQVKGFDQKIWDEYKSPLVEAGNYHKFTVSDDAATLRGLLLSTGDREIVEASPYDRVWGIGFAESVAESNRRRWGGNLLGKALERVRSRLREEEERREQQQEEEEEEGKRKAE
ncbi:hypothetical protein BDV95DRAFT_571487 [Massariosphaeria phaeospora]|uniref:NADAR domain-containing protein n=1 Tax=Massariosphaeria phaeospora TaxID=100035 RepID=A0A7C8I6R6_9PLEO|nr:hypothetical protein BDV95DRAFT_571487 [Massariosphaeria phaeospora]